MTEAEEQVYREVIGLRYLQDRLVAAGQIDVAQAVQKLWSNKFSALYYAWRERNKHVNA